MTTLTITIPPECESEVLSLVQRFYSNAQASVEDSNTAPTKPAVTLEALRQALTKISQDGKAAQIKTLLAEFGARNVKELKSADFAAVLEKAGAL